MGDALDIAWAVVGGLIVAATWASVVRTLIVPRGTTSALIRVLDRTVDLGFRQVVKRMSSYKQRDRWLAPQAPLTLLLMLVTWLAFFLIGYTLLLLPTVHHFGGAIREAGSSMFTLGYSAPRGHASTAVTLIAAATGMIVVGLQIAYLPTIYAAFNRRETEVTLLVGRSGVPAWGPELLARTRFGIRTDNLPEFYDLWERWAADVAESHTSYPLLVRFRSPRPLSNWLIALLAVMDSAALYLAYCPDAAPMEARLCLRMGFTCLRQIGETLGLPVENDPQPDAPLDLTYEEFQAGAQRMRDVEFPLERSDEEAWPHFRGWRVNYEALAYELAFRIDAVPAMWSGPRRHSDERIPVQRPANRTPERPDGLPIYKAAPRKR